MSQNDDQPEEQQQRSQAVAGYWKRLRQELGFRKETTGGTEQCYGSMFGLQEFQGGVLDVAATFAPEPVWRTAAIRAGFLLLSIVYFVIDVLFLFPKENYFIYVAHLTRWICVLTPIYQAIALWITIRHREHNLRQPTHDNDEPLRPGALVRVLWGLYSVLAPGHLLITLVFWSSSRNGRPADLETIMEHGTLGFMVLVDGFFVGKYPMRIKQVLFLYIFCIAFVLWSVFHDLATSIGDGDWSFEDDDHPAEDSLYYDLSWSSDWKSALKTTLLTAIVGIPAIYWLLWTLSLLSKGLKLDGSRFRLVTATGKDEDDSSSCTKSVDEELGAIQTLDDSGSTSSDVE